MATVTSSLVSSSASSAAITPTNAPPPVCVICNSDQAKYKCPGCTRRTCSVQCVREHKVAYECTGKRSKTHYVSLAEFDTSTLLSDYHLLEDIGRVIDGAARNEKKNGNCVASGKRMKWMRNLKMAAKNRGIDLHLAPQGLSIHAKNKSQANYNKKAKKQIIQWTVDLVFPEQDLRLSRNHVKETTTLSELLDYYLHPDKGDPVIKYRLKKYLPVNKQDVAVLMKVEQHPTAQYHKLVIANSLGDNLKGKTVIEFPVLYVLLSATMLHQYPLIGDQSHFDSTDDVAKNSPNGSDDVIISDVTINRTDDNTVAIADSEILTDEEYEETSSDQPVISSGLSLILNSYS